MTPLALYLALQNLVTSGQDEGKGAEIKVVYVRGDGEPAIEEDDSRLFDKEFALDPKLSFRMFVTEFPISLEDKTVTVRVVVDKVSLGVPSAEVLDQLTSMVKAGAKSDGTVEVSLNSLSPGTRDSFLRSAQLSLGAEEMENKGDWKFTIVPVIRYSVQSEGKTGTFRTRPSINPASNGVIPQDEAKAALEKFKSRPHRTNLDCKVLQRSWENSHDTFVVMMAGLNAWRDEEGREDLRYKRSYDSLVAALQKAALGLDGLVGDHTRLLDLPTQCKGFLAQDITNRGWWSDNRNQQIKEVKSMVVDSLTVGYAIGYSFGKGSSRTVGVVEIKPPPKPVEKTMPPLE